MANAPDLSLRGRLRPWQSRRHVAANVGERTAGPGDALVICTNRRQNGKRPRLVIARPRRGRGALSAKREEVPLGCNLGKAVTISPMAFLLSSHVLRDCHVGRWPPRNDKPLVFTILTIACSFRQHCAGRGMPLPYSAQPEARVLFILHFSVFSIHLLPCRSPTTHNWQPRETIHFPLFIFHFTHFSITEKNYKSYGGETYVLCPQGSGGSLVGRRE